MKKVLSVFAIIATVALFSFTTEKEYSFKFSNTQVRAIYQALDRSDLPHSYVKELQGNILEQYQAQVQADSIKAAKK